MLCNNITASLVVRNNTRFLPHTFCRSGIQSSASASDNLPVRCQRGQQDHLTLTGDEPTSGLTWLLAASSSLWAVGRKVVIWRLPSAPCPVGLPNSHLVLKPSQEERFLVGLMLHRVTSDGWKQVTGPVPTKRKALDKGMNPGPGAVGTT